MKAREQQTFAKRWTGVVEIKTGEKVAKLTSLATTGKEKKPKPFPDGSMSVKISLSDFPKSSMRVIKPNTDSKKFRVRLNEDADAVETVTPFNGVFRSKLVSLGPKNQAGEYKLLKKVFNEGTKDENSHLEFLAIYEISEGAFRSVELPGYYLHYKFEDDGEGFTQYDTQNTAQAKKLQELIHWTDVHGNIVDEPIVWNPDDAEGIDSAILEVYSKKHNCGLAMILPELEERALDADREVNLIFENGNIISVQSIEDYEEVYVEDEDSKAVDEMLDGDEEVEPVKVVAPAKANGKLKKAPAKKVKEPVDSDDDL